MVVRMEKKSWWVDFRFNHTRYRKRSPENSKSGAEAYEVVLRHKLARGESLDNEADVSQQKMTFAQFAWQWFDEYAVPNNKHSELRMKRSILRSSLIPFFNNMLVEQITTHQVEQFKALSLKEGVSRKTVNNRLAVFSKCMATAYEWFKLPGTPPKITWLKCPPPKTDHLSPDECTLLLSKANGIIREMILTALRTGMRQGELKGLQWSSINWENRSLTVHHSKCDYTGELGSPKSNRIRAIPMDTDVYEVLFKRKRETGYVFLDREKRPFESHGLERELREVRYRAGLRPLTWHTLRHTFASDLAVRGVPLHLVQALLGHSAISTTMRYAHVAPSSLRTAIDMLNPKQFLNPDCGQPVVNQWLETQQKKMSQEGGALKCP